MSLLKQSILFSRSLSLFPERYLESFHDNKLVIKYYFLFIKDIPAVLLSGSLTNQSKTFAEPSDDDPDSEAESCY